MTKRISEEIDGIDVFTYDTDLLAVVMADYRKPELLELAKLRKYSGLYKLNKLELAIIVADRLTAERDEAKNTLVEPDFDEEAVYTQAEPDHALLRMAAEVMDERRTVARAYGNVPDGVVLLWEEIDGLYKAAMLRRANEEREATEQPQTTVLPTAESIVTKLVDGLQKLADEATPRPKMERYSSWAMSHPLVPGGDGNVMQGHVDYCADWGHATYTDNGRVSGVCPRCGDLLPKFAVGDVVRHRDGDNRPRAVVTVHSSEPFVLLNDNGNVWVSTTHLVKHEIVKAKPVHVMAPLQHGNELYVFEGTDGPSVWLRKMNGAMTWEARGAFEAHYRAVCEHGYGANDSCPSCDAASEPPYAIGDRVRWSEDSRLMFVRQVTPTGAYVAPSRSGTLFAFAAFEDLTPWVEPMLYPNSGLDALVQQRDEAQTSLFELRKRLAWLVGYFSETIPVRVIAAELDISNARDSK